MRWLDQFFLPGPVKRVLAELRAEQFRTRSEIDRYMTAAFKLIEKDAIDAISNNPAQTGKRLKYDHLKPAHLANIIMADILENKLTSGNFHLTRGRMTQEGHAMLTIWHHLIDKIEKAGMIERDSVARIRRDLHEKIMQVG